MSMHLQREIESIKRRVLTLGAVVEENVQRAVKALAERNADLAAEVVETDVGVDMSEVEVEEECLKILALHQPVANDLRFLIAVLKINNDLERVSDKAVNIAGRARFLADQPPLDVPTDFAEMAVKAQAMLKKSLDALVTMDAALAFEVCAADDEVDALNRTNGVRLQEALVAQPERVECLMQLLAVSRHLERIADHATNIAEDVIYLVEGEIVRHRAEDLRAQY